MDDALFPTLPEDLSVLSDEELDTLLEEHKVALAKIEADDSEYTAGLEGPDLITALDQGVTQIETIEAAKAQRVEEEKAFQAKKAEILARIKPEETEEAVEELSAEGDEAAEVLDEAAEELSAEADDADESADEDGSEDAALVADAQPKPAVRYRRPPAPVAAADRTPISVSERTVLIAAAGTPRVTPGLELDRIGLANAMCDYVKGMPKPAKHAGGTEDRVPIATATFNFPPERILRPNDLDGNSERIRGIGSPFLGVEGMKALVASGGLCAPLTPLYDIPDFATTARPVRDALPSFQAERGGISAPAVSTIGSITTAITVIEEEEDAAGGTFATKSCQDMDCPTWTDVAVGAISHCREYGNFNSRAWPEGIAHENNLTMAAHSRTADARLLNRIKALSVNVTTTQVLGSTIDLIFAMARAAAGIRYRLRLDASQVRLRALMPAWVPELMQVDVVSTQFDRFKTREQVLNVLRLTGVDPAFYLDTPSTGPTQGFDDQDPGALDDFPDSVQWALYIEGTFLHLDAGTLELGIVRDSSLNSTNDYQVFGETFENVARIGPAQAALWFTSPFCPTGEFPELAAALAC